MLLNIFPLSNPRYLRHCHPDFQYYQTMAIVQPIIELNQELSALASQKDSNYLKRYDTLRVLNKKLAMPSTLRSKE